MHPLGEDELQSCSFECITPVVTLKIQFLQKKIKTYTVYIYIYSGYGKYSDPLTFFTLCYIAAIC